MDYRNESPVVDLSVKKHLSPSLTPSPLSNSHGVPIHVNVPHMERPQDLSAKGVPYFMPPFDPSRFPHFGFPPNLTGLNLLKTCDKPVVPEVNGERSTKRVERRSGPQEADRRPGLESERKSGPSEAELDSPERRRSLRPRAEVKYNVSPIPLLPEEVYALNGGYTNGVGTDSDDDDDSKPLPLLPLPKEIPPDELRKRERLITKLQAELRQEEMLLYLLRRLKQSQSITPPTPEVTKENVTVKEIPKASPSVSNHTFPPLGGSVPSQPSRIGSVDISPVPMKSSNFPPKPGAPMPSPLANFSKVAAGSSTPPSRAPSLPSPLTSFGFKDELPVGLSITARGSSATHNGARSARATPPVTPGEERMNKFPPPGASLQSTPSAKPEDSQSAAQRQAAAKLALRKQLEKTLLQIPPPKPPPPEMHFIPNPNNTEFVYLLGLETVVDHLLPGNRKQDRPAPPPTPFVCSQCKTDFSPVWKWDKKAASDSPSVMCDQCVSSSVKRALRAEHTARLKSAFMRALQQEQELEQHSARLEQPSTPPAREPPPPPSPRPSPLASPSPNVAAVNRERERVREREMREKAREERQREKMERESRERSRAMMDPHMMSPSDFSKLMDPTKMFNHQAMAALQAAQQMILRAGMGMGSPQQLQAQAAANPLLNPFNPLLYPYQLLAASAAQVQGGKNAHQPQLPAMNPAALAELQRQILLEMIPTSLGHMPGASQPGTSRQSGKDRQRK